MRDVFYRQCALGDLMLFGVIAIPGAGAWVLDLLIAINARVEWPGDMETSAGVYLLLHLLGVLGAGLAFLRLRLGPRRDTVLVTVTVKLWAAGLFAIGVMAGAPAVLLVLGSIDLIQALVLLFLGAGADRAGGVENVEQTK